LLDDQDSGDSSDAERALQVLLPPKRVRDKNLFRPPTPAERRPDLVTQIELGTRAAFGDGVSLFVSDLLTGVKRKAVSAPAAREVLARVLPPPPPEGARRLPALPIIRDHVTMMLAAQEVNRLRRDGEIKTGEAIELLRFVREMWSAVQTYQTVEGARQR
jgi:hypothetical protein